MRLGGRPNNTEGGRAVPRFQHGSLITVSSGLKADRANSLLAQTDLLPLLSGSLGSSEHLQSSKAKRRMTTRESHIHFYWFVSDILEI